MARVIGQGGDQLLEPVAVKDVEHACDLQRYSNRSDRSRSGMDRRSDASGDGGRGAARPGRDRGGPGPLVRRAPGLGGNRLWMETATSSRAVGRKEPAPLVRAPGRDPRFDWLLRLARQARPAATGTPARWSCATSSTRSARLPAAFDGFTILHLSDLT